MVRFTSPFRGRGSRDASPKREERAKSPKRVKSPKQTRQRPAVQPSGPAGDYEMPTEVNLDMVRASATL